jgi:hypothetical protein
VKRKLIVLIIILKRSLTKIKVVARLIRKIMKTYKMRKMRKKVILRIIH